MVGEQDRTRGNPALAIGWLGILTVLLVGSLAFLGYAALAKWRELSAETYEAGKPPSTQTPARGAPAPAERAREAAPEPPRHSAAPGDFGAATAGGQRGRAPSKAGSGTAPPGGRARTTATPAEAPAPPTRRRAEPKRIPTDEAARRLEALGARLDPMHFQFAVAQGNVEQVRLFLEAGLSPNTKSANSEFTLFYLALIGLGDPKQEQVAIAMLDYGADLEVRAPSGITPLMMAAIHCKPRFAAALLESGARLDARDPQGTTALAWAQRASCAAVRDRLRKAGARE